MTDTKPIIIKSLHDLRSSPICVGPLDLFDKYNTYSELEKAAIELGDSKDIPVIDVFLDLEFRKEVFTNSAPKVGEKKVYISIPQPYPLVKHEFDLLKILCEGLPDNSYLMKIPRVYVTLPNYDVVFDPYSRQKMEEACCFLEARRKLFS